VASIPRLEGSARCRGWALSLATPPYVGGGAGVAVVDEVEVGVEVGVEVEVEVDGVGKAGGCGGLTFSTTHPTASAANANHALVPIDSAIPASWPAQKGPGGQRNEVCSGPSQT
jgi:hypothetical protein